MGFLDLFRPKWRHSDPTVRADAVRDLSDDEMNAIERVLKEDPDAAIRRIALKRVSDTRLLLELADADPDEALRKTAADRAHQLLIDRALRGEDAAQSLAALEQLRSSRALIEVAKKASEQTVRNAALARLTEQKALGELARTAEDPHIRQQATERLTDENALRDVALGDENRDVAVLATEKLNNKKMLAEVQKRAKQKAARALAEEKLRSGDGGAAAKPELPPARAQQDDLCRRIERLSELDDLAELELKLEELREEWHHLIAAPEKQYADRFERARQKQQQRLDRVNRGKAKPPAELPPVAKPVVAAAQVAPVVAAPKVETAPAVAVPAVEAELPRGPSPEELAEREKAKEFLGKLVDQIEALRTDTKPRSKRLAGLVEKIDSVARRAHVAAGEELLVRYEAAKREIAAQEAERERAEAEREAQAVERCKQAIGELEALANTDDRKRADQAQKEAKAAFEALADRAVLRNRYEQARDLVSRRVAELRDAEDWRRWSNVPMLEALCAKMEALAAETDLEKLAEGIKGLQAEWKKVGPAPKEKSEALWQRFKKAADEQYARCKEHFAEKAKERGETLKKLEELCVRAEALAQSSEFKETAEAFKNLQKEWKDAGPAPRKEQEVLWKRFRAACDGFFERRKAHFAERDANREENQKRLEQLCARAEGLVHSSDWKQTAERLKELQVEWKEAGPAPKEAQEALWQRFRTACDAFFARRKEHFEKLDEAGAANLGKKQEIVKRAQALMEEPDVEKAKETYRGLMAEWKASGHAPKKESDELWNQLRSVGNAIRDGRIGYKPEDLILPESDPNVKFEHRAFAALANLGDAAAAPAPAQAQAQAQAKKPSAPPVERRQPAAPELIAGPEQVTAPHAAAVPTTIHDQVTAPSKVEPAPVAAAPVAPAPAPVAAAPVPVAAPAAPEPAPVAAAPVAPAPAPVTAAPAAPAPLPVSTPAPAAAATPDEGWD